MGVPSINGYADLTVIGQGGFAVVYRATQLALNRSVAVKVLSGLVDPVAISRFERECATIGSLSGHPHVVSVYDAGTTVEGSPYLAMEYVPRGSLADRIQASGPLPTPQILSVGVQLCDALDAAHRAGVLHRDIKPENVLVDVTGQCKLADFGVAAVVEGVDSRDTAPGTLLGTVLHLAPEVLEGGRAAVASDIYSLGSTLATLALGKAPFARTDDETVIPTMMRIVRDPLPDLRAAGLPDRVAAAIEMAMAKDADERFGSAAAFGNALQQIQKRMDVPVTPMRAERPTLPPRPAVVASSAATAGGSGPATAVAPVVGGATLREAPPADDPPPSRRRGLLIAAALVAVLLAAVVGFVLARQDGDDPTPPTTTQSTTTTAPPVTAPLPGEAASTHSEAVAAAVQLGRDRGLELDVVDTNSYLGPRGLGVMVAEVPDGRRSLVVFYDGHVLGLDFTEPSWTVDIVDQTSESFTVDYALYAAGQAPPAAPIGQKRIAFVWDAERAKVNPQNGPVPPTDQGVDGHR